MQIIKRTGILMVAILLISMKSDKPAYIIYNADGKAVNYNSIIKKALKADVIFFGELHNNPIGHWLQVEITKDIFSAKKENLILGAEMFERDNQLILNEYLKGHIPGKNFEKEAKLWDNYKTDYKPLVEFAKDNGLTFVASNIPRRYASVVHKQGFEGLNNLNENAKKLIAPLPVKYDPELKGYKEMLKMMETMGSAHTNPNLPKAQAIKDATMAYSILQYWEKEKTFLHFNGAYHSNDYQGIAWYLKQENPELNILTISMVEQDTISSLLDENMNIADFIICVPATMTKTF